MLGLSKIYVLVAIAAVAFLPGDRGQQPETVTCRGKSVQILARLPCGPMGVEQKDITKSQCEDDYPNCCFDPNTDKRIRCFSNLVSPNQTEAKVSIEGAVVAKPSNVTPVIKVVESLPTLKVTGEVARSIQRQGQASARSFSSGLASLVFPECAVKTPFCYRTRCNPRVFNAETSPLACLSDPSCCFDRDLFVYRTLFGPAYMNGAPVCYHGPTSARYRQIAGLVQPYNPFFQTVIVDIFKQYFNTSLTLQEQAICVITNAISLLAKQCGWDGITELECQLKGCCYNSNQGACYYPSSLSQSLLKTNLPPENYPELVAEYPGEKVCGPTTAFSQNIYRRLPCRSPFNSTTAYFTCGAIPGCCRNPLALVPGLSSLSIGSSLNASAILAATSGFSNPFGNPFIGGINPFGGISNPTQLISQFFCPYIFFPVPLPGFPDLTTSTFGCCTQQVCYHVKQGSRASWSAWNQWSGCPGVCRQSGQRSRRRQCINSGGQVANTCPGASSETQACVAPCLCRYRQWSQYSPCNAPCGQNGIQQRTRRCVNPNGLPCNSCPGSSTVSRPCRGPPCQIYRLSWSSYGPCGANCRRERRRYCVDSNRRAVSLSLCDDSSNPIERSSCTGDACLPYSSPSVSWSNWLAWGPCSNGCGGGRRYRIRLCLYRGRIGSPAEPQLCECLYSNSQRQQAKVCNWQSCSPGLPVPGGDYSWRNWGSFTTCSARCGGGPGTISRSRICTNGNGQQVSSGRCVGSDTENLRCKIRRPCSNQNNCIRWGNWIFARRCPVACSPGTTGWIVRCCRGAGGCSGGNRQDVTITCRC